MIKLIFLEFFMWVINLLFNPCCIYIDHTKKRLKTCCLVRIKSEHRLPHVDTSHNIYLEKFINICKIFNIKLCTSMHNKNKEYIKKSIQSSFTALWKQCTHDTPLSCVAFSRFATSTSKVATLTFHTKTLKWIS